MEKMDIKELKEVLKAASGLVNAGLGIAKDGKIGFDDLAYLMQVVPLFQPAIDSAGKIPAELKDLTVEEAAELVAFIAGELSLEDEKAKLAVEKGLKMAFSIYDFAKVFIPKAE